MDEPSRPRLYERIRRIVPIQLNVNAMRRAASVSRERTPSTTAFGCFHVRLVTLAFAWFQTVVHIVVLGLLALLILNPHMWHHMHYHHDHHHAQADISEAQPNFFSNLPVIAKAHMFDNGVSNNNRHKREVPEDKGMSLGFFHFVMHSEKQIPNGNGDNFIIDKTYTIEKGADGKLHSQQKVSVMDKNGHKVSILNNPFMTKKLGLDHLNRPAADHSPESKHRLPQPFHHRDIEKCRRHRIGSFGLISMNLLFCLMLIYGVIGKRPILMVPFMCVQVFLLCVSTLCFLGFMTYMPHIQAWILHHHVPMKHELLRMNPTLLMITCFAAILGAYLFKVYMFMVVYRCYKLLQRERFMQARMNSEVLRHSYDVLPTVVVHNDKIKLPAYDEAVTVDSVKNMPPAYENDGGIENKALMSEVEEEK